MGPTRYLKEGWPPPWSKSPPAGGLEQNQRSVAPRELSDGRLVPQPQHTQRRGVESPFLGMLDHDHELTEAAPDRCVCRD